METSDSFKQEPDEIVFSFLITEDFDPENILTPFREKRAESFNKQLAYEGWSLEDYEND